MKEKELHTELYNAARLEEFKLWWNKNYSHISMELTDEEILDFVNRNTSIVMACDMASDYLLSQGLADVQE